MALGTHSYCTYLLPYTYCVLLSHPNNYLHSISSGLLGSQGLCYFRSLRTEGLCRRGRYSHCRRLIEAVRYVCVDAMSARHVWERIPDQLQGCSVCTQLSSSLFHECSCWFFSSHVCRFEQLTDCRDIWWWVKTAVTNYCAPIAAQVAVISPRLLNLSANTLLELSSHAYVCL